MRALYDFLTKVTYGHLQVAQNFSSKLTLFVQGRKESFSKLEKALSKTDKTLWFHCASLGEYEQAVPIIQASRKRFPTYKIVLTFFSPSGYEIKKNNSLADVVVYLPFDTKKNAQRFLKIVRPDMALFIKYEIWPNYLIELEKQNIPAILISGLFRKKQIFFKAHGGFMRKALKTFDHFFVQDVISKELLNTLHLKNVTVSGDTRFDRVSHQIEVDNTIDFISKFKNGQLCVVCGSTWPEDESILLRTINEAGSQVKFIIAPHKIEDDKIRSFTNRLKVPSVRFTEMQHENLAANSVFILDTIGMLTKVYSYADIAYVGGAMGSTGLHNILEPATFGIPIVIGKEFDGFPEAKRLQQLAGLFAVSSSDECATIFQKLINDTNFRTKTGMIAGHFVNSNTGATRIVMNYLQENLTR